MSSSVDAASRLGSLSSLTGMWRMGFTRRRSRCGWPGCAATRVERVRDIRRKGVVASIVDNYQEISVVSECGCSERMCVQGRSRRGKASASESKKRGAPGSLGNVGPGKFESEADGRAVRKWSR